MSIVVVFPAPLGPRNATISPGSISRSMPRTACTRPKSLVTPPSRTAGVFCVVMRPAWSSRVPHPPIARHDSPVTSVRQFADRAVLVACSSLTGRFWLIVVRREGSSGDRRATKSARSTSSERPPVPSRCARDHQKCPVAGLEAELAELAGLALPVLGDLHVQVEVDRGAEEGLDLLAGLDADVAQAGALVADDDALLGVAFDVEAGVDLEQRFVGGAALAQAHLLDEYGDRVGQLVADPLEDSLPDQLGDQGLLGSVGELAVGVELRSLGELRDQEVGEQPDLVAAGRRHRHDLGPLGAGLLAE